jgi:hypothetical protein
MASPDWKTWLSRALLMGLAWAAVWVPLGAVAARLIAGDLDPEHVGGPLYGGFLCGTLFSGLAGLASSRRWLDELSPTAAACWGAASGLFVGVLPFVIGDNGSYENAWSTTVVTISAVLAGTVARRHRGRFLRAAALAAVVSGLLAGVLPYILGSRNDSERFVPLVVIGGLTGLSAASALVSVQAARWFRKQHSQASAASL